MSAIVYMVYVTMMLLPFSGGLSMLCPVLFCVFINITLFRKKQEANSVFMSHVNGMAKLSVGLFIIALATVASYFIVAGMQEPPESVKANAVVFIHLTAILTVIYWYLMTLSNQLRFRRELAFAWLPIPLTYKRWNQFKTTVTEKKTANIPELMQNNTTKQ